MAGLSGLARDAANDGHYCFGFHIFNGVAGRKTGVGQIAYIGDISGLNWQD